MHLTHCVLAAFAAWAARKMAEEDYESESFSDVLKNLTDRYMSQNRIDDFDDFDVSKTDLGRWSYIKTSLENVAIVGDDIIFPNREDRTVTVYRSLMGYCGVVFNDFKSYDISTPHYRLAEFCKVLCINGRYVTTISPNVVRLALRDPANAILCHQRRPDLLHPLVRMAMLSRHGVDPSASSLSTEVESSGADYQVVVKELLATEVALILYFASTGDSDAIKATLGDPWSPKLVEVRTV